VTVNERRFEHQVLLGDELSAIGTRGRGEQLESEKEAHGQEHIIGIFVIGGARDAFLQEIGIVTPFDQIEPSGFEQQIRADGPGQAQVEFRSDVFAGAAGRVLQTSSDKLVFGLGQPPKALLEDELDILQRLYGHELAGEADIGQLEQRPNPREREREILCPEEWIEAAVLVVVGIAIAAGVVVHESDRRRPGGRERISDLCMLKVRECVQYRASGLECRSAELVGGFNFVVKGCLGLRLEEPAAGGVEFRQLALGGLVLIDAGGALCLVVLRYVIGVQLGMEPGYALVQIRHSAEQCVRGDGVRRRLLILDRTHDKRPDLPIFARSQRPVSAHERIGNVAVVAPGDEPALSESLGELTDLQLGRQARSKKIVRPYAAIELQHIGPVFHPAAD